MLNPSLYCDSIWRWGLRSCEWSPLGGVTAPPRETAGSWPTLCPLPPASQGGALPRPRSVGYFDLRLLSLPKEVSEMGEIDGFRLSPLVYGIIVIATQTKTPDLFQHKLRSEQVLTHFS